MNSVHKLISMTTKNIETEVNNTTSTAKGILKKAIECNSDLIVISSNANISFTSRVKQGNTRFIINNSTVQVFSIR